MEYVVLVCSCVKEMPKCPRCRFPKGRGNGHCKSKTRGTKKLFNCRKLVFIGGDGGDYEDVGDEGNEGNEGNEGFDPDYSENADELEYSGVDYDGPTYAYYDAGPDDFIQTVRTPKAFQAALKAGVRHIVIAAHLDMRKSPSPPKIKGRESLNNAVGRLKDTTVSIVVRLLLTGEISL